MVQRSGDDMGGASLALMVVVFLFIASTIWVASPGNTNWGRVFRALGFKVVGFGV